MGEERGGGGVEGASGERQRVYLRRCARAPSGRRAAHGRAVAGVRHLQEVPVVTGHSSCQQRKAEQRALGSRQEQCAQPGSLGSELQEWVSGERKELGSEALSGDLGGGRGRGHSGAWRGQKRGQELGSRAREEPRGAMG